MFSHVKCAGVMRVHSLVDFSAFQWSFCSHESRGECRGRYDLWTRMCMYEKMRFVETAGSEQTSSAISIMLWAKTRVYVCSGRADGNERHLLFYARYTKKLDLCSLLIYRFSDANHGVLLGRLIRSRDGECGPFIGMMVLEVSTKNWWDEDA